MVLPDFSSKQTKKDKIKKMGILQKLVLIKTTTKLSGDKL